MNYSKIDDLYFKNEEELLWIKNIRNNLAQSYTIEQLRVKSWKKKLIRYFDNSILDKRINSLNEQLYEPQKRVKINLNINSLLKVNMDNIQIGKKIFYLKFINY